ncbi:MAG: cation:proton antiporter [Eubacterium sp.]|nr:cation:proton antiporter [Eubacterium sp.]
MKTSYIEKLFSGMAENGEVAGIILSITAMLFLGFLMTRLTKRLRLPNVTAYIVTGILIGPYCLNLIPSGVVDGMSFLSDIALAFIAFSTGEFFRMETIRKNGIRVVIITVMEACLSSLLVFAVTFGVLRISLPFSIVLAALASATAPASTMMTIRQTGAKGDFVNTLLQVVALDDVVGLILYSVAISIAVAVSSGAQFQLGNVIRPLFINVGVFGLGGLFGVLMKLFMPNGRSTDNRLIISIALLFGFCGICAILGISPLLGCMSMGTVYINITDDDRLFMQLNYFTPPILLLFFVRSGVAFNLNALVGSSNPIGRVSLLTVGVVYFITRIAGKYAGSFLGCMLAKKERRVRDYLGLALVPQAGVAIGLAMLGARTLGGETGEALLTIILASSVLYELIGPACAKASLYLSGSYSHKLEELVEAEEITEDGRKKTEAELLIERIGKIQEELNRSRQELSGEEQAFLDAAEEQRMALYGTYRPDNLLVHNRHMMQGGKR